MHEVHRASLNDGRNLAAYFQDYNGKTLAHIRFVTPRSDGSLAYLKGISVPLDALQELFTAAGMLLLATPNSGATTGQ